MRRVAVMLVVLAMGCTDNTRVPDGIIQRPKMEKILWEMVQADRLASSFLQTRKDTLNRNKIETIDLYDKVFGYNGITRQEFLSSYDFYLGRPDILKVMFDSISVRAERKRSEIYAHPKKDSLNLGRDTPKYDRESLRIRRDSFRLKGDSVRKRMFAKPTRRQL